MQINEGISSSGEVARAAGLDLAEFASMIGLLVEKTGLAGSQIGNSIAPWYSNVSCVCSYIG